MKRVRIVEFFDCVMAVFLLCLVFQQRFLNAAVETGKRNEMIQEETKRVALTFDDGPNPEYTEKLLDGLKDREVKATFFLLGNQVELYPDIVKRMHEEGHLIGNHSYDHVNLGALCESEACTQIKRRMTRSTK